MSGLLEVVEKIRVRPEMYLGRPSVSDLFMFLVGYDPHSADVTQIIDIFEKSQPEKFYLPNFSA